MSQDACSIFHMNNKTRPRHLAMSIYLGQAHVSGFFLISIVFRLLEFLLGLIVIFILVFWPINEFPITLANLKASKLSLCKFHRTYFVHCWKIQTEKKI